MISGHFSSFSSFMPILVLVEKVVRLFCALSGLIMSLPTRTTNKISLKLFEPMAGPLLGSTDYSQCSTRCQDTIWNDRPGRRVLYSGKIYCVTTE